jgi:hypothetical protein
MAQLWQILIFPLLILVGGGNPEESIPPDSDNIAERAAADTLAVTAKIAVIEKTALDTTSLSKKSFRVDSSWWSRTIPNKAFGVGERLEFSVKYGAIAAGNAIMEISDTAVVDNHSCFRIVSTANSNDFVSVFYKVRDVVETYVDIPGLFTRRFSKKLREGNYKIDRETDFDQKRHLAVTGQDSISTFAFVQDPLSSLYFIRTQELMPGREVLIDSHTDRKNYPIKVNVLRKEHIEVPAGEFDCIVIEPVMRSEGIFKAKGNIRIWLTDDQYKMPVMMKSEVFFLGSINAQLNKYRRGKILDEQIQKD